MCDYESISGGSLGNPTRFLAAGSAVTKQQTPPGAQLERRQGAALIQRQRELFGTADTHPETQSKYFHRGTASPWASPML
jgi:hypothetical protein